MFLIRLFRFFAGYVIFTGRDGFIERFINLCSSENINIWDVKCSNGELTAKTSARSYRRIRPAARKSGMRLRIVKKCGFPFLISPYLKRKGLLAGLAFSLLIVIYLNSYVWTVDVSGNKKFTDEQIMAIAEEYGIYPGAKLKDIDQKAIREKIKAEVDGINWFTVNVDGSRIYLEVSEIEGSDVIYDKTKPCNIVSGVDGEVVEIKAYTGEAAVKAGSAVVKGDLLISGVRERADGSSYFVHARGDAVIRVKRKLSVALPSECDVEYITGHTRRNGVFLYSLKLNPVKIKDKSIFRASKSNLNFYETSLPIGTISYDYLFTEKKHTVFSENRAFLLCVYSMFSNERAMMENSESVSKTVSFYEKDGTYQLEYDCVNNEKTGIEQYFQTQ